MNAAVFDHPPALRTWPAYGLALLTGILYFLGFPGIDIWPLSLVALVPLIVAMRGQTTRRCTGLGWVAGMGMTVCGFYWLREMLVVFSKMPEPLPTLFMVILCAYQSGRIALCGWLYGRAANRGWPAPWVFAGAFAASEMLWPLLFPWFYGASVHNFLPLLQVGELGGPVLVGLVLVAPNVALAQLVHKLRGGEAPSRAVLVTGVALPLVALVFGFVRIGQIEARQAEAPSAKVALIQGNQPLLRKTKSRDVHRRLTVEARKEKVDLAIWSEGAVPARLFEGHEYEKQTFLRLTRGLRVPTIVGTLVHKMNPPGHPRKFTTYNTALMTDANGQVTGRYDKQFLLMFGEYLPFGDRFPKLYELSPNSSAFSEGTSLEPLPFGDGHRLSTTICYEDILPGFFNDMVRAANPDLLVNITNDAWFGDTTEPWIHLALAKLRTVEHRRYLARATNSGVSAIVDATGKVVSRGGTFQEEIVYGDVRFMEASTVYETLGDKPWWALSAAMVVLAFWRNPRAPKPEPAADADAEPTADAESEADADIDADGEAGADADSAAEADADAEERGSDGGRA